MTGAFVTFRYGDSFDEPAVRKQIAALVENIRP